MRKLSLRPAADIESNSAHARHHCTSWRCQGTDSAAPESWQQVAWLADIPEAVPVERERKGMANCYTATVCLATLWFRCLKIAKKCPYWTDLYFISKSANSA